MSTRMNYHRARGRARMASHGSMDVNEAEIPGRFYTPRPRPSKASQRAGLSAAIAAVTRRIECQSCGHSASVALPPAKLGRRLRCSQCGETAGVVNEL